jgi:hypothetical protein
MEAVSATVLFNPETESFRLLLSVPGQREIVYMLNDEGQAEKELWGALDE